MDFTPYAIDGEVETPYAAKKEDGGYLAGSVSLEYLNSKFSECTDLDECIELTDVESEKLLFQHLKNS